MEREYDSIELAEFAEERRARTGGDRCRCGGDMPGHCPGPSLCPLCESREDEDDNADGEEGE